MISCMSPARQHARQNDDDGYDLLTRMVWCIAPCLWPTPRIVHLSRRIAVTIHAIQFAFMVVLVALDLVVVAARPVTGRLFAVAA